MSYDSNELLANVMASGQYARPHHFGVEISPPLALNVPNRFAALRRIGLNCSSATLPGRTIATREDSRGGTIVRKLPHSVQFADMPLSFYLSDDLLEKNLFDSWQDMIYDDVWQNLEYFDQYAGTVTLNKTSRRLGGRLMGSWNLVEAWPLVVGDPEVSYAGTDQVMTLPVTMAFRHWEKNA